ncbi:ferritin-like domain-containing protein [Leptolyngbyaceae cyanobacterium UHCC 1019]
MTVLLPSRSYSKVAAATFDLAGYCPKNPSYLQTRARVNRLIDRYLTISLLSDRLTDLPSQFTTPHTRPWEPINWKGINPDQVIGIDPALFALIIAGATEIEAPIRAYSQESWDYLEAAHPQMAFFMGGACNGDGSIKTMGVWEKEERQHAPALRKIYQQLTGEKLQLKLNSVTGYQPNGDPWNAVYHHTLLRITTEWSAAAVYLWLMAHSTGDLQQAIAQPLQDEVNHLAKFWGFNRWAFAEPFFTQMKGSTHNLVDLLKHHQGERTHSDDLMGTDHLNHAIELTFTLMRVMVRLRAWNKELSPSFLTYLFGISPMSGASQDVA